MDNNIDKIYEERKKDLVYEIHYIQGVQYNFKLDDFIKLLDIQDIQLFKKYLYYVDKFRLMYPCTESFNDTIQKFKSVMQEDEQTINELVKIFVKHQTLFIGDDGFKKLKLVPKEFDNRIFKGC